MENYLNISQIIEILFLFLLVYFLFRFILTLIRKNRISYYSLNISEDKYNESNEFYKVVYKFSDLLKSLVLFNGLSKSYDKYITKGCKYRDGIDFISLKFIQGFICCFIYLLISFMSINIFNIYLLFISFAIGFQLIDLYLLFVNRRRKIILKDSILDALIVMVNNFKISKNNESSILSVISKFDGVISFEFKKLLNDIKLGFDLHESILRMYKRLKIEHLLDVYNILLYGSKNNISVSDSFYVIEKKLVKEKEQYYKIKKVYRINQVMKYIFLILPILFVIFLIFSDKYINLIINNFLIVVPTIFLLYLLYFILMEVIIRRSYYDK